MRVIVISVLLFISVVVADEAGVAINPAEEAGIGETVDSVREEGISVAINPAEESGIGETVDPVKEKEARKKKSCERNCKPMRNGQPQTAFSYCRSCCNDLKVCYKKPPQPNPRK